MCFWGFSTGVLGLPQRGRTTSRRTLVRRSGCWMTPSCRLRRIKCGSLVAARSTRFAHTLAHAFTNTHTHFESFGDGTMPSPCPVFEAGGGKAFGEMRIFIKRYPPALVVMGTVMLKDSPHKSRFLSATLTPLQFPLLRTLCLIRPEVCGHPDVVTYRPPVVDWISTSQTFRHFESLH